MSTSSIGGFHERIERIGALPLCHQLHHSFHLLAKSVDSGDVEPVGETIKYATIVVATLPILALYPFLQRYFVKGVLIGGVKE